MHRLAASVLGLALLPALAAAQQRLPEIAPLPVTHPALLESLLGLDAQPVAGARGTPLVLPLWQDPDGRIMAAVALQTGSVAPLAPQSPQVTSALDWRLVDATALLTGNLRLAAGTRLEAAVRFTDGRLAPAHAGMAAPECLGVPAWLGRFGTSCDSTLGHVYATDLSAGWRDGALSLGVAYGLSWKDGSDRFDLLSGPLPAGMSALPGNGASALPGLVIPFADLDRLDYGARLGAFGRWEYAPSQTIDVGASLGHVRLYPDFTGTRPALEYQQAAVSLGLGAGAFSSSITGRVLAPQYGAGMLPGQRQTSVDLGVSWRTPWRGELRVGAQNLWTSPPARPDDPDSQPRTPYVQYHQDL